MKKFLLGMFLISSLSLAEGEIALGITQQYKCKGVFGDVQEIINNSQEVLTVGGKLSYPLDENLLKQLNEKNEKLGLTIQHTLLEHKNSFNEEQINQLLKINETYNNIRNIIKEEVDNDNKPNNIINSNNSNNSTSTI